MSGGKSHVSVFSHQNAFVQLSLAFRNDNYTLESRLKQAERERGLTEENTEKELEEFKSSIKVSAHYKRHNHTHRCVENEVDVSVLVLRCRTPCPCGRI